MSRARIAALHARTAEFRGKLARAERLIGEALAVDARGYVSLSGGKDSTVVQDLVRRADPSVPSVWSDDVFYLPETAAYMDRLREADVDLRQIRTTDAHTPWFQTSGTWQGVPDYARAEGWTGVFLGLRADENARRRMHLRAHGLLYRTREGTWQCNPLAWWSSRDVWAYIVSREVDYNRAYDVLERIGVPPERQRIGPYASERALGVGMLSILKRGWPAEFQRFADAHPEACAYA